MIAMAEELGLGDQLRFNPVGVGFFADGEMHDFNGIGDLLRFSPLAPAGAAAPGLVRRPVPAARLLRASSTRSRSRPGCGGSAASEVWERIWKPLLDSRFDGDPSGLPATYLWARTRRMSGARDSKGSGGEEMGHIVGGHQRLIDAMVDRRRSSASRSSPTRRSSGLATAADGAVTGVELDDEHARTST